MNLSFRFKKTIITTAVAAMAVVVFLVYALAGLDARPVVFADPPAFVERYVAEMDHSDLSSLPKETEMDSGYGYKSESAKLVTDFSREEALVFKVIMDRESLDELLRLFAHPEKAQRIKVASAFAAVQIRFTHDDESGFPEKRDQFWVDEKEHFPNIQNALCEALIASAEEGTPNYIPYTLAWLPGQGRETIELFAWAAKHHPDPGVRRSTLYYVVKLGGDEDLVDPLLRDRRQDPEYSVRKEALALRFRRFTGKL